jgi:hypothetical protein
MKSLKVEKIRSLSLAALLIASAIFVSCSKEDDFVFENQNNGVITVETTVSLSEGTTTRALVDDGTRGVKTFQEGEEVAIIYTNTSNEKVKNTYTIQGADISNGGKDATLRFGLTNPKDGNSKVTLVYPAYLATIDAADGIYMESLQASQDGTLSLLSTKFDVATAVDQDMTVSGSVATLPTDISLTNPLCIGKFSVKDDKGTADTADDEDITSSIKQLTICDGTNNYVVNRTPEDGPIYVAMRPVSSSATIKLTAVTSTTPYKKSVSGKALAANKIYPIKVSMAEDADRMTPLTLEATKNATTVYFTFSDKKADGKVEYSTDGTNWTEFSASRSFGLGAGVKIMFRGDCPSYNLCTIECTDDCYIYGNIMSLINSTNFATETALTSNSAFNLLFYCYKKNHIINHPDKHLVLPATSITPSCYRYMFYRCEALTTAPELPATNIQSNCYEGMLYHCTSLTTAPKLLAKLTRKECYMDMFGLCTSLVTAPELPATTLGNDCYKKMFYGCTNLATAPELPATSISASCYAYMFQDCTNLATAPALPATTMKNYCYEGMFEGCTNLSTAPALPATTMINSCYERMFYGCTNLSAAPELPATTLAEECYKDMFNGCTSLTTAPVLPATTLTSACYKDMFNGCSNLNKVTCLATNPTDSYTWYWLQGVADNGTFVKASGTNWSSGIHGIPSGWTVVEN